MRKRLTATCILLAVVIVTVTVVGLDLARGLETSGFLAIGAALAVAAGVAGYAVARVVCRPIERLANPADDAGRGRLAVRVPASTSPEAGVVGSALQISASRLQELMLRERTFASIASHVLRTPITALRLELEDLALWEETPPPVGDQLRRAMREVDRLSSTVTNLLELARGRRVGVDADIDVCDLADEAVARWEGAAHPQRRTVQGSAAPR
jgi:signal transduction histidine kinase